MHGTYTRTLHAHHRVTPLLLLHSERLHTYEMYLVAIMFGLCTQIFRPSSNYGCGAEAVGNGQAPGKSRKHCCHDLFDLVTCRVPRYGTLRVPAPTRTRSAHVHIPGMLEDALSGSHTLLRNVFFFNFRINRNRLLITSRTQVYTCRSASRDVSDHTTSTRYINPNNSVHNVT